MGEDCGGPAGVSCSRTRSNSTRHYTPFYFPLPDNRSLLAVGASSERFALLASYAMQRNRTPYPGRMSTTEEFEARVRVDFAKSLTGQEQIRKCNPRSAFSQS